LSVVFLHSSVGNSAQWSARLELLWQGPTLVPEPSTTDGSKGRLSNSTGGDIFVDSVMSDEIKSQSAQEPTRRDSLTPRRSEESLAPRPISMLNWKLVAWGGLIALLAVAASELTSLWWLVLVFGLLVPAISSLQAYWSANRKARPAIRP
jgi:hypothetical protein